ncbi:hypothetical protein RR48_14581 [Papilio machaon]|uniref:Uncharacterized protein n=1 Tax=Papilio machaon TaxID=76193 RepID=A0A194QL84_PAPMA|nr:hypothetical protein RR48_14581 [Papilio machaon]
MSGTGVASRSAEPVSLPAAADLPVRIYMRALRQYHKLLDLKRFTFKEKTSFQLFPLNGATNLEETRAFRGIGCVTNIIELFQT